MDMNSSRLFFLFFYIESIFVFFTQFFFPVFFFCFRVWASQKLRTRTNKVLFVCFIYSPFCFYLFMFGVSCIRSSFFPPSFCTCTQLLFSRPTYESLCIVRPASAIAACGYYRKSKVNRIIKNVEHLRKTQLFRIFCVLVFLLFDLISIYGKP